LPTDPVDDCAGIFAVVLVRHHAVRTRPLSSGEADDTHVTAGGCLLRSLQRGTIGIDGELQCCRQLACLVTRPDDKSADLRCIPALDQDILIGDVIFVGTDGAHRKHAGSNED
jgi:hypothetical protein